MAGVVIKGIQPVALGGHGGQSHAEKVLRARWQVADTIAETSERGLVGAVCEVLLDALQEAWGNDGIAIQEREDVAEGVRHAEVEQCGLVEHGHGLVVVIDPDEGPGTGVEGARVCVDDNDLCRISELAGVVDALQAGLEEGVTATVRDDDGVEHQ